MKSATCATIVFVPILVIIAGLVAIPGAAVPIPLSDK
jgi:hypothetical protein